MLYDTVDTVYDCIRIATGVMSTIKTRPDKMLKGGDEEIDAWIL
jgi:argininosuccinate lyase